MHKFRPIALLKALAIGVLAILVSACGAPPKLVADKTYEGVKAKSEKIILFYQTQEMTVTKSESSGRDPYGRAPVTPGYTATGFLDFGPKLIEQAPTALAKHRLELVRAEVVPPGEWRPFAARVLSQIPPQRRSDALMVTISPRAGRSTATSAEAHITFRFSVRVVDMNNAKPIWDGTIDAYTYTGNSNFGNKGFVFDAAYADLFLNILTENLKKIGAI